jgi:cytochrome o ubiquinol oxidase subunit 2
MVTWSVPILVILFLGGMTWVAAHELDPAKPLASPKPALEIDVVSLDWKWLFIYPAEGIATVNAMTVPVDVPIHLRLTSASVMNTFFVPRLGSMIYTMNGMADNLYLMASEPGVYPGLSGHFSGDGFSDMHFQVSAVADSDFNTWVGKAKAAGASLDPASYASLARQGSVCSPMTYRSVSPDLFDSIVRQQVPPGPGPENLMPAPLAAKPGERGCLAN